MSDIYRTTQVRSKRVAVAGGTLQVDFTEEHNGEGKLIKSEARVSISESHRPHGSSLHLPTEALRDLIEEDK